MRSGRGKCPQCKETITVDLDAAEIRCPFCNALLKKSSKTVAEVRAEEAARVAAAEARERALRGEPEEAPVETAPVETAPVEPAPAASVAETPVEESIPDVPVAEETAETSAEEPTEESVDEIGMTDEELAALDDVMPTDSEEAAEPAEAVDEIGLSDEELAAMDETIPVVEDESATAEDTADETAPAEDAVEPVPAEDAVETADQSVPEEPIEIPREAVDDADIARFAVTGSVSDEDVIEDVPETDDINDVDGEEIADEGLGAPYVAMSDEPDEGEASESDIEITEDAPESEEPTEAATEAEEDSTEDVSEVAEVAPEITDEATEAEEAAPTLMPEAPEEAEVSDEIEIAEPEELSLEDAPLDAIPEESAEEETATAEAAYTDEDMAFAASLSDGLETKDKGEGEGKKVGYVAPVIPAKPANDRGDKPAARAKNDAPKGEKKMSDSAIYKKPVAIIMMILALVGAAISLLFTTNVLIFSAISDGVAEAVFGILENMPEFIVKYVGVIFGGVAVLISILGLTGKRGKPGFFFALLASLVYTAVQLFGGLTPVIEMEAVAKILAEYGEYVSYAIYGALFVGALAFAISIGSGREALEISGGTAVLPIVYMLIAVVGTVALVILPKVLESFAVSADLLRYAVLGVVGLSILLTLIGVHSKTASRGANAWLLFAATMIVALIFGAITLVDKLIPAEKAFDVLPAVTIFSYVSPCILFFPLIGYTISDMRN